MAKAERANKWCHLPIAIRIPGAPRGRIITGVWLASTRSSVFEKWAGHEAQDEDQKSNHSPKAAITIQGHWIVDRKKAEKANAKQKNTPNVPAGPEMEHS